jgi:hypothetical protein
MTPGGRRDESAVGREQLLSTVGSIDRRNTLCKSFGWRLIKQGLSWTLVELPSDCTEFGLAVHGQVGAAREILA